MRKNKRKLRDKMMRQLSKDNDDNSSEEKEESTH